MIVYITTSDIKRPPKHPMNYKEKVRHMTKMGIPKSKIIKEKVPLSFRKCFKKYNPETTVVVYIFVKKIAVDYQVVRKRVVVCHTFKTLRKIRII